MVRDFGADGDVGLLNPYRVSGWFDYAWGDKSPKTYNLRLTAVSAAYAYWRDQEWLTGDPVSRLRARPTAPDNSKAMTTAEVDELLGMDAAALRERVFWSMLYESAARAEEILNLDIEDLDTVNRCATVVRKGGARDVIYWQTGTARLLPRLIAGRKKGPLLLTDRRARPSVAKADTDDSTGRARLFLPSRRHAARRTHRRDAARTLHAAPAAALAVDPRRGEGRVHADADGAERTYLGAQPGQIREGVRRGPGPLASRDRSRRAAAFTLTWHVELAHGRRVQGERRDLAAGGINCRGRAFVGGSSRRGRAFQRTG
ncbi:tyrosine-type recombinase/integrase [Nocardia fusca]